MGLSNSITFRNLGEGQPGLVPRHPALGDDRLDRGRPVLRASISSRGRDGLACNPLFDLVGKPDFRDCLRVAGVVSLALRRSTASLLPHTPPVPAKATDPIEKKSAVLESLELMRFRSFAVLVLVAGLIGIMLAFYFACENYFLDDDRRRPDDQVGGLHDDRPDRRGRGDGPRADHGRQARREEDDAPRRRDVGPAVRPLDRSASPGG